MPNHKMTFTQKREATWKHEAGKHPLDLAKEYGVTRQYIYKLIKMYKRDDGIFEPCATCGSDKRIPLTLYCSPECDTAWEAAFAELKKGTKGAMSKLASTTLTRQKNEILNAA